MSWRSFNPFYPTDENTRYCYGHSFQWTSLHQTPEELEPLKYTYDTLAEKALNRLDEISPPDPSGYIPRNSSRDGDIAVTSGVVKDGGVRESGEKDSEEKEVKRPKRDLYKLLEENAGEGGVLGELWDQVNTIPDWVDWDQIQRGQDVFYRYGIANLSAVCLSFTLSTFKRADAEKCVACLPKFIGWHGC